MFLSEVLDFFHLKNGFYCIFKFAEEFFRCEKCSIKVYLLNAYTSVSLTQYDMDQNNLMNSYVFFSLLLFFFVSYRMLLVTILNITSFLLIANSEKEYLAIIGVVFTSLALGIGEVTLLSYSARFDK